MVAGEGRIASAHTLVAAYGHSWVYGTGAKSHHGFAYIACRDASVALSNRAVSGSVSTQTADLVAGMPPLNVDVMLLMTGLNDARRHGLAPTALRAYRRAVQAIVDGFLHSNPSGSVIAVSQPQLADYSQHAPFDHGSDAAVGAYNRVLSGVMESCAQAELVSVEGWDSVAMLAEDTVHPNDWGHRWIAAALTPHLCQHQNRKEDRDGGSR